MKNFLKEILADPITGKDLKKEKQLLLKHHSISVRPYQLKVGFLARYIYIQR